MGESEDRGQRTEDSNVARMQPAEYGGQSALSMRNAGLHGI